MEVLAGGPARLIDLAIPGHEPLFGPADVPTSARALGLTTAVIAPVVAAGRVVGSLGLGRGPSGRRFVEDDVEVAVDLGRRIGLAWHNAVLLSERASILSSLHDGLIVTDGTGVVSEVNERWCELSGFTAAECLGARMPYPWWPTEEEDPAGLAHVSESAGAALRDGRVESRLVFRRADRTAFPALVSVAPVVDRDTGDQRGLVASVKDLSAWESTRDDLAALQRMTARLAAARSVADVASATLEEVVARFGADAVFLTCLDPNGQQLELLRSGGRLAERIADSGGFPVDRDVPATHAVRDNTPVMALGRAEIERRFPDLVPEAANLGIEAIVAVPVPLGVAARAALSMWLTRPRVFGDGDVELLEAMAIQCGEALARAEGYDVEHRSSQILQDRLLADVEVLHDRATVVTRYQPATPEVAVGGDWYDVVHVGPDRLAVVVGDVVGSGVDAAAVMGQLRSALKAVALASDSPVTVLEALDRVARTIAGAPGATVCYVVVDLAAGTAEVARAGHPQPLVVDASGAAFVDVPADPPLGFARRPRRATTIGLPSGSTLVLYSDGLVERRGIGLTERFDVLLQAAATARQGVLDDLVDDVVAACVAGAVRQDDLAVLAVRDEPAGASRFRALVPARARELAGLRHGLRDFLGAKDVARDVIDDIVLATSEAATNAVEHAYSDRYTSGLVGIAATVDDDGTVRVHVRDAGRWKTQPSATSRGRGLGIARALMSDVVVRTGPSGTTVLMAHAGGWLAGVPGSAGASEDRR